MIGMFDSGCGGLTVLRAIRARLPDSDIVYFGDTKNAPYGLKSREELTALTASAIRTLQGRGATHIASACNSVSASLALSLFDELVLTPENLVEMVGPTVAAFRDSPTRVLVCATPATIDSGIYQSAFAMIGKDITAVAMPAVAGAIEQGMDSAAIESMIRDTLGDIDIRAFDVLVLACTHYPLVKELFSKVCGEGVLVVDPSELVADRVERDFGHMTEGEGTIAFLLSAESAPFRQFVSDFFPDGAHTIEVIE